MTESDTQKATIPPFPIHGSLKEKADWSFNYLIQFLILCSIVGSIRLLRWLMKSRPE